ncbi:MAG: hypothetical protein NW207_11095 [Cytophagales bacterium]|nr:hypothetical protein [Cytophagales bacterium]
MKRLIFKILLEGKRRQKIYTAIFCIFISCVIWIITSLNKNFDIVLKYPIAVKDGRKTIAHKQINVYVSGYGWYLFVHSLGFYNVPISVKYDGNTHIPTYTFTDKLKQKLEKISVKGIKEDTLYISLAQ